MVLKSPLLQEYQRRGREVQGYIVDTEYTHFHQSTTKYQIINILLSPINTVKKKGKSL